MEKDTNKCNSAFLKRQHILLSNIALVESFDFCALSLASFPSSRKKHFQLLTCVIFRSLIQSDELWSLG